VQIDGENLRSQVPVIALLLGAKVQGGN